MASTKKVLVRSRIRHVKARTVRTWERGVAGEVIEKSGFRQFIDHHAYMTPAEAAFLIDSKENQKYIDAGHPPMYYYPAGSPLPVDANKDGALALPLTDQSGITNADQAEAAREVMAEQERSLAAQDRARLGGGAARIPTGEAASVSDLLKRDPEADTSATPVKLFNPDLPGDDDQAQDPTEQT